MPVVVLYTKWVKGSQAICCENVKERWAGV